MASADARPGDRHAHPPIAYRPPVDVRAPLVARAEQDGRAVSAIITEALREYLGKLDSRDAGTQQDGSPVHP